MIVRIFTISVAFFTAVALVAVQHLFDLFFGEQTINILIVAIIFVSIIFSHSFALLLAVFAGVLFDIFTFSFGTTSIALIVNAIIVNALFVRFFTNRSLWTLILLGGFGTLFTAILYALFFSFFQDFLPRMSMQILLHTGFFILFFLITRSFTARLKPYLLIREPK